MTPKEKAEELVKKYRPLINDWNCYWDTQRPDDEMMVDQKKCALIAVGEIIEQFKCDAATWFQNKVEYWNEVKQEINIL